VKSKLSTLGFGLIKMSLVLSALIASGCGTGTAEPASELANPASVYCEGQGYTLEMRTDADGGQYGVCIFPDGSECEEWAFYRGECSPVAEQAAETPTTVPTEAATTQPTETPTPVEPAEAWVYVDLMTDQSGTTVTWMDSPSGSANSVPAPGTRYQLLGEWVYYQEGTNGTVHRVNRAGQDERFDFMDIPEDYWDSLDWAISPDGTQIAWKRNFFETGEGYDITLTSDLYVATIASGEARLLTTYVVHEHQTLTPWGFSPDGSRVFVYLQPYGIGGLFAVYGAFSVLDVATGQLAPLPDPVPESLPTWRAALSDDGTRLARFQYMEDEGFKLSLTDLASGQTTEIATTISTDLGLVQVGDGVFSPDGSTLIYTVAYGDWGSEGFALFQVDLTEGTQRELLAPQPTHYKVVHFEDDGSLLLTVAWPEEGTGTVRLHPDGTLEHLSDAALVGVSQ
jgi:putative hemolysin